MAYWYHMASQNLVNNDSGNGFLPDSTKPLPEFMFTNHQCGLLVFTRGKLHRTCSRYLKHWYELENDLRVQPHLPGANELTEQLKILWICMKPSDRQSPIKLSLWNLFYVLETYSKVDWNHKFDYWNRWILDEKYSNVDWNHKSDHLNIWTFHVKKSEAWVTVWKMQK